MQPKKVYLNDTQSPGPGAYEPSDNLTRDKSPQYKMGTTTKERSVSKEARDKPGPGHYDKHDHFGKNAVTYSMRGKPAETKDNGNPGPGNYDAIINAIKERAAAYKMGTSNSRADAVGKET